MSIINDALKKTQTNFNNLRGRPTAVADDRIAAGQKTWQPSAAQPAQPFTQAPSAAPASPALGSAERRAGGPATAPAPQAKRTSSKRWYLIVTAEILVLGLAAWTLLVFQPQLFRSSFRPQRSSAARNQIAATIPPQPAAPLPQPVPAASVPQPPETKFSMGAPAKNLVLSGIMMDQNKMVALINGEIYETGDYVDGKRISKIALDRVELLDGEGIVVLNVRNQGR